MAKKLSASSPRERLRSVRSEDISNRPWTESELRTLRRVARRQALGDDSHIDLTDIPPLTEEQLAAMVPFRELRRKVMVSVPLDTQVVAWLRSKGNAPLTRINGILANAMAAERKARHSR
jgi:uncharacterized protein (DUF4415 family)